MNRYSVALLLVIAALLLQFGVGQLLPGSPVPGDGFHMLVIEDRSKRTELPPGQFDAMFSTDVWNAINQAGGRRYLMDRNQDVSVTKDEWLQKAMQVPQKTLPGIVIDKDGRGEATPLQATPEAHKAFVEKYLK